MSQFEGAVYLSSCLFHKFKEQNHTSHQHFAICFAYLFFKKKNYLSKVLLRDNTIKSTFISSVKLYYSFKHNTYLHILTYLYDMYMVTFANKSGTASKLLRIPKFFYCLNSSSILAEHRFAHSCKLLLLERMRKVKRQA